MPPRDDQEYEQRRQQIISGALQAFSNKGFDRASNRDIAEAAKIGSPGLIYHYFKDKEDLLYQVLLERMPLIQALDIASGMLDLPPQELLPRLADLLDKVLSAEATIAIMRIVLAEAMRNRRVAQMVNEVGPGRALRMFSGYLERQMAAGRLRRMDPGVAARLFVGPILAYMMTRYVFQQEDVQQISPAAMAHSTAEAFLRALAPEPDTPEEG